MINKQIATHIPDLSSIVDMLLLEGSLVECNGLMHGKMGIVIFFFHYAQHTNDKLYEEYAMEIIESVLNDISLKTSVYYRRGLAGIGCAIEYLSQKGFLEIDTDDIFEDLDKCIFDAIMDYRDEDITLFDGLSGLGRYCSHRVRIAKKNPSREKNSMATVKQLGTIDDTVYSLVYKEFTKGNSWFQIRNQTPCTDCVFQWLCPSPSSYEILIGRPNLCNVLKKNNEK